MERSTLVIILVIAAIAVYVGLQSSGKTPTFSVVPTSTQAPKQVYAPTDAPCSQAQDCIDLAVRNGAPNTIQAACDQGFCAYPVEAVTKEGTP